MLHLVLIASDNAAARVLARVSHGGTASFVERMNEKALELGLENTSFADPSGLNPNNVSSAYDLSRLISFAAADERIAPIMRTATYTVKPTAATINIHSTNRLRDGRHGRDGREDRLHQQGGLLPGHAAAAAARAIRSRSSSSAPSPTPAASGKRATCSTGCPKGSGGLRQGTAAEASRNWPGSYHLVSTELSITLLPATYLIALLNRCRVERQRRDAVHDRHDRSRRAPRIERLQIPLDTDRTHTADTGRRGWRTT